MPSLQNKSKAELIAEIERLRRETGPVEKETGDHFQILFDNAPLPYQSLDKNGRIIEVNQTWLQILGYKKEEAIGKWFGDFLTSPFQKHFKNQFPKFKNAGHTEDVEFDMVHKNGTIISTTFNGLIANNSEGDFQQTHCIFKDISEQKKWQNQLKDRENHFRWMFDSSPVALWEEDFTELIPYLDEIKKRKPNIEEHLRKYPAILQTCAKKVKVLNVNKATLELYQASSKQELLGNLDKTFTPGSFNVFRDEIIALANGETFFEADAEVKTLKGELKTVNIRIFIEDASTKPNGSCRALVVTNDIRLRKTHEKMLAQHANDLALINSINEKVNSGVPLKIIIEHIAKRTSIEFDSFGTSIFLLNDDKQYLLMQNLSLPPTIKKSIELLLGRKIPDVTMSLHKHRFFKQAITDKKPVLLSDIESITQMIADYKEVLSTQKIKLDKFVKILAPKIAAILGIKTVAIIPLFSDQGSIGVMTISSKKYYSKDDIKRLEVIAGQITGLIKRKQSENALKESEQFNRIISETIPNLLYVYSFSQNKNIWVNSNYRAFLKKQNNITNPQISLNEINNLFHPDDIHLVFEAGEKLNRSKSHQVETYEFRINSKSGWRWMLHQVAPLKRNEKGEVEEIIGSMVDITDKKTGEIELIASEEKYKHIVENIPDIIYTFSVNENSLYISSAVKKILGFDSDDFYKNPLRWFNSIHPDDISIVNEAIKNYTKGVHFDIQYRIKDASHKWHWFQDRSIGSISNSKEMVVEGVITDITKRKTTEIALDREQKQVQSILRVAPIGIGVVIDRKIKFVNKRFEEITGYKTNELIGKNSIIVYPSKEEYERVGTYKYEQIQEFGTGSIETTFKRKDGTLIDVFLSSTPLDPNDLSKGVTFSALDISWRKQNERELEKSNNQLRLLSSHLQTATENERKRIAREVHDDLGQALTALKIDMASLTSLLPKDSNATDKIVNMLELTNSIIQTVRRLSSELRPSILDNLGLAAALDWYLEECQQRTGIKCTLTMNPDDIVLAEQYTIALYRIIQEAITNAVRHAETKRLKVDLSKTTGFLDLVISDEGIGFDEKKINSISSFGILGMKERVISLKGTLEIKTNPGKGTKIIVKIPLEYGSEG